MACWLGAGLGLACLPSEEVLSHHWIVGTPFHYVAIAVAGSQGAPFTAAAWRARARATAVKAMVAILLVNRLVVLSGVMSGNRERAIVARVRPGAESPRRVRSAPGLPTSRSWRLPGAWPPRSTVSATDAKGS
jgi:hypothetical protein